MGKQSAKNGKKAAAPQPKKQDDSNGRDVGMSVDGFRTQLRRHVENVCRELGTSYDKEQDRGFAFEVWAVELLLRIEGTDADPADVVYKANDLKVDIAFEEEDGKVLVWLTLTLPGAAVIMNAGTCRSRQSAAETWRSSWPPFGRSRPEGQRASSVRRR